MKKYIDTFKEKMLKENIDNQFNVDDIILYNGKQIAKVIKLHDGYNLLRIKIYHPNGLLKTTNTDVSSTLCEKFEN